MWKNKKIKYIVGIDEAGRGPLAGPVAVATFCVVTTSQKSKGKSQNLKADLTQVLRKMFPGARDSKKMSAKKREEIFEKIRQFQKTQNSLVIRYIVQLESAEVIDRKGISWAIKSCIKKCLKKLEINPKQTFVLLDGGIKAPEKFIYQKTIIGGDDKEIAISLASICAKVTRDAYMRKMAKIYPLYGFERHKGYGTLRHRKAIRKHGLSKIHRKSFLKNLTTEI